ncbi:hypothetical protein A3J13_01355 [Candidatus Daviesbacteria bacterium RIFCSPLOWO2_02_FULL_36_8]|uniref:Uncharacterized protein n=2 Tax=Patescibacteria group TaxID=1783273 RepID=A0A1G2I443_9BACT|nr:MAG: hypothetical protein A3J13_01355 [Candidatus Daviesbacteria bacterium RIFCSPLOWO2_02_FULL_36_8]OGZ69566.1 MAG: hypothetical protein A3F47_01815 [Candidatus Staskawiczbacteria bacterium RIFCSPHIGHO2_12_FULL_38_11]
MIQEAKNYLVSLKDRTLGIALARRYKEKFPNDYGNGFSGVQNQLLLPLTMEVANWIEDSSANSVNINISNKRRLVDVALKSSILLGAFTVDMAGNFPAFVIGMGISPIEGIALKGAINLGTHVMVDAIKYSAHHISNFRAISLAAV